MPNWVTHRIVLTGSEEDLRRFIEEQIAKNRDGEDFLDFNRVIPRPEALDDDKESAGSEAKMAWVAWYGPDKVDPSSSPLGVLGAQMDALETYLTFPWVIEAGVKDRKDFQKFLLKRNPNAKKLADRIANNLKNYHATDWYEWSIENWGVKWNASGLEWVIQEPERLGFLFDTAWDAPEPIFQELSRLYPEVRIDIWSFDEQWNFACQGYYIAGTDNYECGEATKELYEAVFGRPPEEEGE